MNGIVSAAFQPVSKRIGRGKSQRQAWCVKDFDLYM